MNKIELRANCSYTFKINEGTEYIEMKKMDIDFPLKYINLPPIKMKECPDLFFYVELFQKLFKERSHRASNANVECYKIFHDFLPKYCRKHNNMIKYIEEVNT
jgi:hypothetical protein